MSPMDAVQLYDPPEAMSGVTSMSTPDPTPVVMATSRVGSSAASQSGGGTGLVKRGALAAPFISRRPRGSAGTSFPGGGSRHTICQALSSAQGDTVAWHKTFGADSLTEAPAVTRGGSAVSCTTGAG